MIASALLCKEGDWRRNKDVRNDDRAVHSLIAAFVWWVRHHVLLCKFLRSILRGLPVCQNVLESNESYSLLVGGPMLPIEPYSVTVAMGDWFTGCSRFDRAFYDSQAFLTGHSTKVRVETTCYASSKCHRRISKKSDPKPRNPRWIFRHACMIQTM
jgi:hypothetical protein